MNLNELLDKSNSLLSEGNEKFLRIALKEAASKFKNHPSTASLNWAYTRYMRLTEYDERMGSTEVDFRTGQLVRFKNRFFGSTFHIQAIDYNKQKARIVNKKGFSKVVRFSEIKPLNEEIYKQWQ